MTRARVLARRQFFSNAPFIVRMAAKFLMVLCWPIGAVQAILRSLSSPHAARSGKTKISLAAGAYWFALRYNVPPLEYFTYRLWEPGRAEAIDDFLYWSEVGNLTAALNKRQPGARHGDAVNDKLAFFEFCRERGVATPEVLAVYDSGVAVRPFAGGGVPGRDLWLKPVNAKAGVGAERWAWRDGGYHDGGGRVLDVRGIEKHIGGHSTRYGRTLVQPVIKNHPDVDVVTNGALATARIITGLNKDGTVEALVANMVLPVADRIVVQGGLCALIDMATGRLGPALEPGSDMRFHAFHPVTKAAIEGLVLPHWGLALDVVRRAHGQLTGHVFLGWDVAFSGECPMVIETNGGWGAIHLQMLMDKPFGQTRFVDVLEQYV